MRTITGAILILAAEQAFSHAYLIGFPHQAYAQGILVPAAMLIGFVGVVVLFWGFLTERKST
jgi:hypothetical protein